MAWYCSLENQINRPRIAPAWHAGIVRGMPSVVSAMAEAVAGDGDRTNRPCVVALDGYKGVAFGPLVEALARQLEGKGFRVTVVNINQAFRTKAQIEETIRPYLTDDPCFGRVYPGALGDLVDGRKIRELADAWEALRGEAGRREVVLCHGVGAAAPALRHLFDRIAYLDITREEIIRRSDLNQVAPVGSDTPEGFPWKRIYYVEYPVLNRHKKQVLREIDWYVDSSRQEDPALVPAELYHALMVELSGMPLVFKVFYMPGMFGGTEFGKRFNVPGLPNTSWDYEISVGDSHLLVDVGHGKPLEMPFYNVLWEQPLRLLGSYSSRAYPDHFPIAIYMQDGYFPPGEGADFHRTHMPNHLHPDTPYAREHFDEPLGRYETYYIVRADAGAVTMHGFRDDADIDEYVERVEESARSGKEFDWRRYIHEHPSRTGELHQIPPGTVHGTGGRQIIMEIDTNPSRESTEYSFFLYDYCRPTFNYQKNDFTGKRLALHLKHSLAVMRRNRRQTFMSEKIRPAPVPVRQGPDWREVSFPMYYNMPYQINRLEFTTRIEDRTGDLFQCLSLTLGERARVSSKRDPANAFVMEDCDNIVLPACFGEYVCENMGAGECHILKTFLITEPREHIDKEREERDWGVDPAGAAGA